MHRRQQQHAGMQAAAYASRSILLRIAQEPPKFALSPLVFRGNFPKSPLLRAILNRELGDYYAIRSIRKQEQEMRKQQT
jgi:hypothetical protein